MSRRRLPLCALFASLSVAACQEPGIHALHVLPGGTADHAGIDFFSLPFPSDVRLIGEPGMAASKPGQGYDLSRFPRPMGQPGQYVSAIDGQVSGAGPGAAMYFRFEAPLDTATLPKDAAATVAAGASVRVVDITPGSPTYGQATPVEVLFHADENRYIGANWLSLRPLPGIPLRERTTYAAILSTKLRSAAGERVEKDADLERLLDKLPPEGEPYRKAWKRYAPLRDYLHDDATEVAGATVFTTQDATSMMTRLHDAVNALPAPKPLELRYLRDRDGLCQLYLGSFESPNFQTGEPPYWDGGGGIETDAQLRPGPTRTEKLRFALSVPNGEMPKDGWPIIIYAHGTGGDYQTFVRENLDIRAALIENADDPKAAPERMAMIGIDQVLHGPRDPTGANPELTFFNMRNLLAARDNVKQGAADDFQVVRLVENFRVERAPTTGRPIRFDPKRIYFVGHSQGGLTGPLFLAAEPKVQAAVLSGAGSVLILSLLNKKEPNDVAGLVEAILMETPLPEHPMLNLLQAYFESSDPNNYGPRLFKEPLAGVPPKNIMQTLGVGDNYTPVPNIVAFALSMGVQPVTPRLIDLPGLELVPMTWTRPPVSHNVAGGKATGVVRQYQPPPDDDGHFVIFDLWAARHDWSRFLASHSRTGIATFK